MDSVNSSELSVITQELYKKNLELVNANKELALLQKLYEIMMSSYHLDDLCQQFINVIVRDLSFLSGIVFLKNPLNSHLDVLAITQTKEMVEALRLIKQPVSAMQISLHNQQNTVVHACKTRHKIVTKTIFRILTPLISKNVAEKIDEVLGIKSLVVYPLVFNRKTLGAFVVSMSHEATDMVMLEKDILKQVAIVFGVAIDRVRLYRSLKVANQKLKDLDKRKDEFLSVAAHEMRAPLTAVKGYLSMVLEGDAGEITPTVKEFLSGAVEGAEREVRLVNNMLNVSRIEEDRLVYQMGTVHLRDVVQFVYDEFKLDAQNKGLQFTLEKPENIADEVYVDQDRIHEVVANFTSNAIKYTDKGSVVMQLMPGEVENSVRFEVRDTGFGISEVEKAKLFQKFFRCESSAGKVLGTGLGLYITKLLIEKFGGRLGVESELGKGSTFWFELPVVCSKNLTIPAQASKVTPETGKVKYP